MKGRLLSVLDGRPLRAAVLLPQLRVSRTDWGDPDRVLRRVLRTFPGAALAVRSSAAEECGRNIESVGHYRTVLAVDASDTAALRAAFEQVIDSLNGRPGDEVLVQPMAPGAVAYGVVRSEPAPGGADYLSCTVDRSGDPRAVTGGLRDGEATTLTVLRFDRKPDDARSPWLEVQPWGQVCAMHAEVEARLGCAVEVEFALTSDGPPIVLQARPLGRERSDSAQRSGLRAALARASQRVDAALAPAAGVPGGRGVLGAMPDWNPAEIIGARPRPLALDLYRRLIGRRVWRRARRLMGYRALAAVPLLVEVAGRCLVDVRASVASFVPAGVPDGVADRLVDDALDRLRAEPGLHDKIEFDLVFTAFELDLETRWATRHATLPAAAVVPALRRLTERAIAGRARGGLGWALAALRRLRRRQRAWPSRPSEPAEFATLVREGEALGCLPFACIARHAFIAEALLRSAVRTGALEPGRLAELRADAAARASCWPDDAVPPDAVEEVRRRWRARWGHLRPGTYDLRALTVAERGAPSSPRDRAAAPTRFELRAAERVALDAALRAAGMTVDAVQLVRYYRRAVRWRERAKLDFTRHLSRVLDGIAVWGAQLGLSRDAVSMLDLPSVVGLANAPHAARRARRLVADRRDSFEADAALRLPALVVSQRDLRWHVERSGRPNFVGRGRVEAPLVTLDAGAIAAVRGAVVCIECADPGCAWIFAAGAVGLITRYGGPNSHMAVRCAEAGVPGALGCGAPEFERIATAARVLLDADVGLVQPIGAGGGACASG